MVKKPEDKVASESQDLEFECEIYGKPKPKITWLKNGEKIKENEYWQIVNGWATFLSAQREMKIKYALNDRLKNV